jgi:16S rRNA (adenine1518-N6/adenine1519-N6)-dimethyltransferase
VQTVAEIKALLAARGIRPKHRFGQNFLHDRNQLLKLVEAARVQPGEVVLEVGPGTGTLTEELVAAGATVIAAEIDPDMIAIVRERLGDRVTVVAGDCLAGKRTLSPDIVAAIAGRPFLLVANLPYGAASPLMAILATRHPECRGQYVTVQREVADRLLAPAGGREYGPLTIAIGLAATVRDLATVKPASFWPMPEVTSAMIAIEPKPSPPWRDRAEGEAFEGFVSRLFSARRKQIGSTLGRAGPWPEGIEPSMRPEELAPPDLWRLFQAFEAGPTGPVGSSRR